MIDSIKIILYSHKGINVDHLKDDASYYRRFGNNNQYKKVKKLKNLKITVYEKKIVIEGSLTVFIYGHNLFCPSHNDIVEAIDELSEELKINIDEGIITRIDLGHNFFVDKPIPVYLMNFWACSRTKPSVYNDGESFLFRNSQISISMYDKISEHIKKYKFDFSGSIWEDKYFFRYELQLKRKVARRFKMKVVTVRDLKEIDFYLKAIRIWKTYYDKMKRFEVSQESDISFIDIDKLKPKKLFDILAYNALQYFSAKKRKVFFDSIKKVSDYQTYFRIMKKIESLSENHQYNYNAATYWNKLDRKVRRYYTKTVRELKNYER